MDIVCYNRIIPHFKKLLIIKVKMMKKIDFRSDTVTWPTEAMRLSMAHAEVGDDVYGDDPTVLHLERVAAQMLGKEAALFVPSGTFGNQLAILTHTKRGDEVIVGDQSHIVMHEVGGAAVIAGVQLRQIPTHFGKMSVEQMAKMIREDDIHYPDTGLICVENAHSSGVVIEIEEMAEIYALAQSHGIPVHLDGARLFNAAASLSVDVGEIAKHCDSVMFCLSKGLCAPFGSILAGDASFIKKARKNRKLMGGGMRQAGIMAAAGLVALDQMTGRLNEDHSRARVLGKMLSEIDGVEVLVDCLDINMVFCKIDAIKDANAFVAFMGDAGYLINGPEDGLFRFVTHHWISDDAVLGLVDHLKRFLVSK